MVQENKRNLWNEKLAEYIRGNTELQVDYDKIGTNLQYIKKKIDALAALSSSKGSRV